ncbi:receptor-transporting protein 3-like [Engraulis encrasicolus]|uniref:receptor-transporting protein 3-like n=1 Tax=Engraulis encrasicolus TaxID=184585 RepID=UPI002FD298A6
MSRQEWQNIFSAKTKGLVEKHGHNWILEFDDTIEADKQARFWYQYTRGAFARFRCSKCNKDWTSKKVLVVFHFQLNKSTRKGTVKAHHFRQECKTCEDAEMEKPKFAPDNIKALLEKLVERIDVRCYTKNRGNSSVRLRYFRKSDGPHEAAHCEACQKGFCGQAE